MMAPASPTKTCGQCGDWQETKAQCPGMGYCSHSNASVSMIGFNVPLSCELRPAAKPCWFQQRRT